MTWLYNNKPYTEAPEQYQGFVYLITNTLNRKLYIGQKNFWAIQKLKPLKGKTNRRHRRRETDWQQYFGSSEALLNDLAAQAPDTFRREILYLCVNKTQMNYFEAREQFNRDVLLKDEYYNGIINCRITARGLTTISQ